MNPAMARSNTNVLCEPFDEDYYLRGEQTGKSLYTNYRWLPSLSLPFASALCDQLDISVGNRVLDYGCARGYLVKALRILNREAYGIDASTWAVENCDADVRACVFHTSATPLLPPIDIVLCKDVLEHMTAESVEDVLLTLSRYCDRLWVCVPLGANDQYIIPEMERDSTHVLRRDLDWWAAMVGKTGWLVEWKKYCMAHVKERWTQYKDGYGFVYAVVRYPRVG